MNQAAHLLTLSSVAEEDATGRFYAFATRLHDGETVYIPSLICEKEGIDYSTIGDRLWAFCSQVPGRGDGTRLTAFVRWDGDDEKADHVEVRFVENIPLGDTETLLAAIRLQRDLLEKIERSMGVSVRYLQSRVDAAEATKPDA